MTTVIRIAQALDGKQRKVALRTDPRDENKKETVALPTGQELQLCVPNIFDLCLNRRGTIFSYEPVSPYQQVDEQCGQPERRIEHVLKAYGTVRRWATLVQRLSRQGHPKIARRFNGGFESDHIEKSRQGRQMCPSATTMTTEFRRAIPELCMRNSAGVKGSNRKNKKEFVNFYENFLENPEIESDQK